MSIKLIFTFLLLAVVSTYFAFLNPIQILVNLTQTIHFEVSQVVFLLGSVLMGALGSAFIYWTHNIGRSFKARKVRNRLIREIKDRDMIDELFENGETFFSAGKLDKAQSYFEKILHKYPEHLNALYHLGVIHRELGKLSESMRLHNKAVSIKPDKVRNLYALAEAHIEAEQPDEAITTLQKIRILDRGALLPLYKLRNYLFKTGEWNKACDAQKSILPLLDDAEELEEEQNKFSEILFCKSMNLYKNGKTSDAIIEFKCALKENNRSVPAYVVLGDIYLEINDTKQAIKTWKAGFDNTGAPVCLQRIHDVYQREKYFKDLVKMYKSAINSSQGHHRETLGLMLANFYLENNKPDEVVKLLKGDLITLPKSALLAEAYERLNIERESAKITREIFEQAQQSIQHFACRACETLFVEWSGHCPNCNAWDSFQQGGSLNSSKPVSAKAKTAEKAA